MRPERLPCALVAAAAAVAWLGCSGDPLERLRAHTYPPNFEYIPAERLQSTMWQLADHAGRLDRLMRLSEVPDESLQIQVIAQLTEMERAAAALGSGEWPSNHPRVTRNIARFREDLETARRAAALDPPNYFFAGSIAGACLHCHVDEPQEGRPEHWPRQPPERGVRPGSPRPRRRAAPRPARSAGGRAS
jgi:hypothetical protein